MDSKGLQVLFLALRAHSEDSLDDVTMELVAVKLVTLVNQAMGDRHSEAVNDLSLNDVRTKTRVQRKRG